jgi:Putative Ig domain
MFSTAFCFPCGIATVLFASAFLAMIPEGSIAANPPVGADRSVALSEDGSYTFGAADFGFTDPDDVPGHNFDRIKLTTLPTRGSLKLDGIPATAGGVISMKPVPGIVWTAGNSGRNWMRVASSADGLKLVVVQSAGPILLSTDGGSTWLARESVRNWVAVASSADGTKLAAIVTEGRVYTSSDSGETWTARDSNRPWYDIASSADGTKLIAAVNGGAGQLYTSHNSGITWTARESNRAWVRVASSADGTRMVAFPYAGSIYYSADSGVTWIDRGNVKDWKGIASSADGSRLIGLVDRGSIFKSTDYGVSWQALPAGSRSWNSVASSADGSRLTAGEYGEDVGGNGLGGTGRIYVSQDFGATWTPRGLGRRWGSIASSADGTRLIALEDAFGVTTQIHRSSATIPQLVFTPAAQAFGTPYADFTFQVGDDGGTGMDLDPTPNTLTLNVAGENDPPTGPESLTDQTPITDSPFLYQVPAGSFADADPGTVLTYAATWQDGGMLPSWLVFDPATLTFSGTPRDADEGTFRVVVTATDAGTPPLSASTFFMIRISTDAPAGTDGVVTLQEDQPYTFRAADFGFTDPDDTPPDRFSGVTLTSLPAAGTLTIEGTPVSLGSFVSMVAESEQNWTPRETNRQWAGVASSADGMKLAAIPDTSTNLGRIYLSRDAGVTWMPYENARRWRAVASSADGTKLVAVAPFDQIFTSADSGLTWTARAEALNWSAVASSADGTKLVATVVQGYIYVSGDSGVTWTHVAEELHWSAVAASADGTRLIAADGVGRLYTSVDSGATWTPRETNRFWRSVASSADGRKLVATGQDSGGFPGRIYTSTNAGLTWTARESARNWSCVASSADGSKLVAVDFDGPIYTSRDSGVTWLARDGNRRWFSCASSADGDRLIAAAAIFGGLYLSVAAIPELVFTPVGNASGSPYTSLSFQVEDDGTGASTRDPIPRTLILNVSAVNDAPTVANAIPDQNAVERVAFSYQAGQNTFRDVESTNLLTYSAGQANGDPLPGWLSFNVATRTFTGTPSPADAGLLELKIAATDNGNPALAVSAPFLLAIANIDEVPEGSNGSTQLASGQSYSFGAADFGFADRADFPPNTLTRIRLTTLPASGVLTVDGVPAVTGGFAAVAPAALGTRWTPTEAVRDWQALASSTDGTKLVAVANGGFIYTSTDSGTTWTRRDSSRAWRAVTSSSDGTRLAAAEISGYIYTSSDSGVTWIRRGNPGAWYGIECSSDGAKLAAVSFAERIYTSVDFGVTWTARANSRAWYSIASSTDGTKLAAVVRDGQIFTSTDSGVSWLPREIPRVWRAITSSADGTRLAAVVQNGRIYTSLDAGVTWTPRESSRNWYDISSSADGMVLTAVANGGRIYTSTNAGVTWKPREATRSWRAVVVSPDGMRLAASGTSSQIYISTALPAQTLLYTPPTDGAAVLSADLGFQVEDDGALGSNLDPSPNRFRLNYPQTPFQAWAIQQGLPTDPAADAGSHLIDFACGLNPDGSPAGAITMVDGMISRRGLPALLPATRPGERDFSALFGRRKNAGLTYQAQFSAGLLDWETSQTAPVILADDGVIEACLIRFPDTLGNGQPPRFFRISVSGP